MPASKALRVGLAAVWALFAPAPGMADAPLRIVSINVCTDQLAMMLVGPEQSLSVSHLAVDPRISAMSEQASAYDINHARAEEIYLMKPDLVVAGAFAARATVNLLEQFDVPVEIFTPVNGIDDIPSKIEQMGRALGREEAADALIRDFTTRLTALRAQASDRPSAVLYFANGYTSGDRSLAGEILETAGFSNIAAEVGYSGGGILPLEVLAMAAPDIVVTSERYPGNSRSEAILEHPVVEGIVGRAASGLVTDRDWVCGTPHVLRAIDALAAARRALD